MSDYTRQSLDAAGQAVTDVRASHPDLTLDEMCVPNDGLPQDLLDAYASLDKLVDRAFGMKRGKATTAVRQRLLFDLYEKLAIAKH